MTKSKEELFQDIDQNYPENCQLLVDLELPKSSLECKIDTLITSVEHKIDTLITTVKDLKKEIKNLSKILKNN